MTRLSRSLHSIWSTMRTRKSKTKSRRLWKRKRRSSTTAAADSSRRAWKASEITSCSCTRDCSSAIARTISQQTLISSSNVWTIPKTRMKGPKSKGRTSSGQKLSDTKTLFWTSILPSNINGSSAVSVSQCSTRL